MATHLQLTSTRGTPLFVRRDAVLVIEGCTYGPDSEVPDHVGARLTLAAGQWSETVYCLENAEMVISQAEAA